MQRDLSDQVVFNPLPGCELQMPDITRRQASGGITLDWSGPRLRVTLEGVSAQEYLQAASRLGRQLAAVAPPEPERGPEILKIAGRRPGASAPPESQDVTTGPCAPKCSPGSAAGGQPPAPPVPAVPRQTWARWLSRLIAWH